MAGACAWSRRRPVDPARPALERSCQRRGAEWCVARSCRNRRHAAHARHGPATGDVRGQRLMDFVGSLLTIFLLALVVILVVAPFESLKWWAGWVSDDPDTRSESKTT